MSTEGAETASGGTATDNNPNSAGAAADDASGAAGSSSNTESKEGESNSNGTATKDNSGDNSNSDSGSKVDAGPGNEERHEGGNDLVSVTAVAVHDEMNAKCRHTMEDAHCIVDKYNGDPKQGFFAVYDGHGGRGIVDFVAEHYHKNFAEELNYDAERSVADCVTSAYLITDIQSRKAGLMSSGSTAVTCFLQHKNGKRFLHIANVGDARAVLSANGKAVRLTYDHKATDEKEQKRIEEAGGFVLRGRVLGILAVARSFGDHGLKQFVSARPHITITEVRPENDFVALCCDGVFDVMEDQDVVQFIRDNSADGPNPDIAKMIVEEALKRRSTDNITAMVVYL